MMDKRVIKNIVIIGSTGTIGQQALDVITKESSLCCVGLACGKNIPLLAKQISEHKPFMCTVPSLYDKKILTDSLSYEMRPHSIFCGNEGWLDMVSHDDVDGVLIAVPGIVGLRATLKAIQSDKDIYFINKEVLAIAGSLVMDEVRKRDILFLPVDSEHEALFRLIRGDRKRVKSLVLPCSGGPFYGKNYNPSQVSVQEALQHPTWKMGPKITIDSATLMNKALEIIEAYYLFDIDYKAIHVRIHRASLIHGLVQFIDGSIEAYGSASDMRYALASAMLYPNKNDYNYGNTTLESLLEEPWLFSEVPENLATFISCAYSVLSKGSGYSAVMSLANEEAVYLFLEGKIVFSDIFRLVLESLRLYSGEPIESIGHIEETQRWVQSCIKEIV